jgi:hypothetical protein
MGWILFTAVDLYIGVIVLDTLIPTLPAEKHHRAKLARKVVVVLLAVSVFALVAMLVKRWSGWA